MNIYFNFHCTKIRKQDVDSLVTEIGTEFKLCFVSSTLPYFYHVWMFPYP